MKYYYPVDFSNPLKAVEDLIEDAKKFPAIPQRPLFILIALRNTYNDMIEAIQPIQFSKENLDSVTEMVLNPGSAWSLYEENKSVGSDLPSKIFAKEDDPSDPNEVPNNFVIYSLGLLNTNRLDHLKEYFKDTEFGSVVKAIPPFTVDQRHNHGFMNLKFNPNYHWQKSRYLNPSEWSKFDFWNQYNTKREDFCLWLQKMFQFPYNNDDCLKIPCVIYTLQIRGVEKEVLDLLWLKNVNYGNVIRTQTIHDILKKFKIQLKIWKLSVRSRQDLSVHPTANCYPRKIPNEEKEQWRTIEVAIYQGHMMIHYKCEDAFGLSFLSLLGWAIREAILIPLNAFEYADRCLDAMCDFDQKLWLDSIKNIEPKKQFKEDLEEFHVSKWNCPPVIYFADFECTTDEKYHCPFLICYKGPSRGHFIGVQCGEDFLKHLLNSHYEEACAAKCWKRPYIRVYFHNLAYDFTFLWPYLTDINGTMQGNTLYEVIGTYKFKGRRIIISFGDTLKLIPMSLSAAANTFLDKETLKTIRKEAFPYEFYTYKNFKKYGEWCPLEDFRKGFSSKQTATLKQFDDNLDNLPECLYNREKQQIHLMNYAIFYCEQDVNVLKKVFKRYKTLFKDEPFCEDITNYRTITSLAYAWFLKNVVVEYKDNKLIPRHDFYQWSRVLRKIGSLTVRGGRTMVRDNRKIRYNWDGSEDTLIQDFDAVSLYPSAISVLWISEGKPHCIQGKFTSIDFLTDFTAPEAPKGEFKKYNDGWIHLTYLNTKKERHFPLLCIKDPKTKINNYQNFHGEVDTWVNAIDLFNLIDFQDAEFRYDAAVVWKGERFYECRDAITKIFNFRLDHPKPDPMNMIAKLIMNSMYGKSTLKVRDYREQIVDATKWRRKGTDTNVSFEKIDNWRKFFNANAYCIKSIECLDYEQPYSRLLNRKDFRKYRVKTYEKDYSPNFVSFGSNVLAMARRIIGRVMALAEDIEEMHPEWGPSLFYTDTDSMHITNRLLKELEIKYQEKYQSKLVGTNMLQFHSDFEVNKDDKSDVLLGAQESIFIMKKVYVDKILIQKTDNSTYTRLFRRGKGFPSEALEFEDYERLFNDEPIEIELTDFRIMFYHNQGHIGSRASFKRTITSEEFREKIKEEKKQFKEDVKLLVELEEFLKGCDPTHENDDETIEEFSDDSQPLEKRQRI